MKTITIKNKYGTRIYSHTCEGNTLSKTIAEARKMKVSLSNIDFSHQTLKGVDLSNLDLTGANFSHCILDGVKLKNTTLTNAKIIMCKGDNLRIMHRAKQLDDGSIKNLVFLDDQLAIDSIQMPIKYWKKSQTSWFIDNEDEIKETYKSYQAHNG